MARRLNSTIERAGFSPWWKQFREQLAEFLKRSPDELDSPNPENHVATHKKTERDQLLEEISETLKPTGSEVSANRETAPEKGEMELILEHLAEIIKDSPDEAFSQMANTHETAQENTAVDPKLIGNRWIGNGGLIFVSLLVVALVSLAATGPNAISPIFVYVTLVGNAVVGWKVTRSWSKELRVSAVILYAVFPGIFVVAIFNS